ncbi:MAG: HAMP domain-containing sensor histidine kinase [Actinomycetota bacterium]
MRRRLTVAIVGMVVAALLLTGVGTITLTAINDRADTEADLRDTVESLSELFVQLTIAPRVDEPNQNTRDRLQAFAESLSVDGIGILILPRSTDPIGDLPVGVEIEDLDLDLLQTGATQSNRQGDVIWAARGATNRNGLPQLLVLTDDPDPILLPAFRWFLVASVATIIVAGLVAARLSRSLTGPIRAARDVTGRIADGDLDARIPDGTADGTDEVGDLVTSINSMADNLERSKALERQFLMSVSHDLRTPLTSIKGYAEALADGAVDDHVRVGGVIEAEAARLERLVGDLLLLARLESTDFPLDRRTVDLNGLVDAAVVGLEHEAKERDVSLTGRVADAPVWVHLDPDRYAQIVGNLVGNALRFANDEVVVTLWQAEGRIHLAVGDDGPGIADADLPHVFERLYVAKHNPAVKESGSGLGLAIVRDLVERMGGSVTARRSALGGAEFVVSFSPAPPPTP